MTDPAADPIREWIKFHEQPGDDELMADALMAVVNVLATLYSYPFKHMTGPEATRTLALELRAAICMKLGVTA